MCFPVFNAQWWSLSLGWEAGSFRFGKFEGSDGAGLDEIAEPDGRLLPFGNFLSKFWIGRVVNETLRLSGILHTNQIVERTRKPYSLGNVFKFFANWVLLQESSLGASVALSFHFQYQYNKTCSHYSIER